MSAIGIPIYISTLVNSSGAPVTGGNVTSWVPTSAGTASSTPRSVYTDPECSNALVATTLGTSGHKVLYRRPGQAVAIVVKSADNSIT